jgi:hypothetical protein
LDIGFFIHADHKGILGRREIEPHYIRSLCRKPWVRG